MTEKKSYSRRDFLKIVGASTGVAVAGCGTELPEKIIPYVVQPDEVVPGIATWYAAACNECSAGCGTLVRTREGRVVKVEGNSAHPVNRGGLCAVGQSSVQGLYDPDRIREPLVREAAGVFKPASWKDAVTKVADTISAHAKGGKGLVLITKPLSGSEAALTKLFRESIPKTTHIEYSFFATDALDRAAERVFGEGARTHYDFSKADVIVGFGADYLETWLSPVEFMKGYASGRRPEGRKSVSKTYHFEPRLSLTAANADTWFMNAPGREASIMVALLAAVAGRGGNRLDARGHSIAKRLVGGADIRKLLDGSGVKEEQLFTVADALVRAERSLVVAGGAAVSGPQAESCAVVANALNFILGNVGTTVLLRKSDKKAGGDSQALAELIESMQSGKSDVGCVILYDVDPVFTLPGTAGVSEALAKAGLLVSLSTNLDHTTRLANVVLPLSTSFEAWNDGEAAPGVFNLNQPSMQPLYKTQGYGDTLLALLSAQAVNQPVKDVFSFHDFIRAQWRKQTGEARFEERWLGYVAKGGSFGGDSERSSEANPDVNINLQVVLAAPQAGLTLLAFPTVQFMDGRSANRPWMQEIPDPITTAVWDSWVEMHPDTAKEHKLRKGDVVQVRTREGFIEAPLYLSKYVHRNVVAVPIGQGNEGLGRYASGVGVNPLQILDKQFLRSGRPLTAAVTQLERAVAKSELVVTQYSDSQLDRGIFRSVSASALATGAQANGHGKNGHSAGHHETGEHSETEHQEQGAPESQPESGSAAHQGVRDPHQAEHAAAHGAGHHDPHALGPRPAPPQMYRQMPHVQYRWGMTIDLASCTGCTACVTACYAENNVPVVGKDFAAQGREMSWIRIERYMDGPDEHPVLGFQPMLCQHCNNAPCEPVCPVYATYHGEEGLNTMVYNRCVGTRYCSNNCSYKVRRFNWFQYNWPEPLNWQLNPDVTVRSVGVMEKCTFCVQRIKEVQNKAKDEGRQVQDGEIQPACASSCPADAIRFGNLLDPDSVVSEDAKSARSYKVLDAELNTQPAISYLAKVTPV